MKKILKPILCAGLCLSLGACAVGLTGCNNELTEKANTVVQNTNSIITDTTAIKTALTTIDTAIATINTELQSQSDEVKDEIQSQTTALTSALTEIKTLVNTQKTSIDALAPKLDAINTAVSTIALTINENIDEESAKILTSLQTINTSLSTINSKVENIVTAIGSQTTDITNSLETQTAELTVVLNAQTNAINATLAAQTDALQTKIDELKEKLDVLINKETTTAWNLYEYAMLNMRLQDSFKFRTTATMEMSMFGQTFKSTSIMEQFYSQEFGIVTRNTQDDVTYINFFMNEAWYEATIEGNTVTDVQLSTSYPTNTQEGKLSYAMYQYLLTSVEEFGLKAEDICLTNKTNDGYQIHFVKTIEENLYDNNEQTVIGTMTYIAKAIYNINNEGKILSVQMISNPISSTLQNVDLSPSSMTFSFEYFEENENAPYVEVYGNLIKEYLNTIQSHQVEITSTTQNKTMDVVVEQTVIPGDTIPLTYTITNNSGSALNVSLSEDSVVLKIANQDISSEAIQYFDSELKFYSNEEMTNEITQTTPGVVEIQNGQTVYVKYTINVDADLPGMLGGQSVSTNPILYHGNLYLICSEIE